MGKRPKFGAEQIVVILRQIEVAVANGKTTALACKEAAIATFALKAAVWFRRGRLVICAPRACHLNGSLRS